APASLRRAIGITRGGQPLPPEAPAPQDRIRLANGDLLTGIVADIVEDSLILQIGADPVAVPLDSIAAVYFAATGRDAGAEKPGFQLRFTDGSTAWSPQVRVQGDEVQAEIAGDVRGLSLTSVAAIEHVN